MLIPPNLKAGDEIRVLAISSAILDPQLAELKGRLRELGLRVSFSEQLTEKDGPFAGSDETRLKALQTAMDDPDLSAILFYRGGYGAIRITSRLNWSGMLKHPKWLIGYSDITHIHLLANNDYELTTLHADMPLGFLRHSKEHLNFSSTFDFLFGRKINYSFKSHPRNQLGSCDTQIIGGNLSCLYAHVASGLPLKLEGKILLLEEIGEYYYHIDRMMQALSQAGVLSAASGFLIGKFSGTKDGAQAFGKSIEEIVLESIRADQPVAFDVDIGHDEINLAIPLAKRMHLAITESEVLLTDAQLST